MFLFKPELNIILPAGNRQDILGHCHRAIERYRSGDAEQGKAFGLVFGKIAGNELRVGKCCPLDRNVRSQSPYKEYMDSVMAAHAIPSVTPLEQRGWVADPAELFARIKECRTEGLVLLGTYHMHRVGWKHDPVRDTPTKLDAILVQESGLLMFIVSMVNPAEPAIRAFYEGILDREIPIL